MYGRNDVEPHPTNELHLDRTETKRYTLENSISTRPTMVNQFRTHKMSYLLPEQYIFQFHISCQHHGLLIMNIIIHRTMYQEVILIP